MLTSGSMSKTFADLVPPMMAESAGAPFDSSDWIFEIKLDGYWAPGSQSATAVRPG
jgi:ATP-dependent DNA ligase